MHSHKDFYAALPKRKAELVDGKMYVAGSLRKSAMVLGYMVEKLGAEYVSELCPKELLREAVAEVFRQGKGKIDRLADFSAVEPGYYRPQKLGTDLQLGLFRANGIYVSGGGTAIKLGEDVFTPDVHIIREERRSQWAEYYFEGAPDLIMEVVHPYMYEFDYGIRMERYARAGVPEVWMLHYQERSFEPFHLKDGKYIRQEVSGDWFVSSSIPALRVQYKRVFDTAKEMGIEIPEIFEVRFPEKKRERIPYRKGVGPGSVPFAPRLALDPVPITFPEFISWGGEVKFELIDGKPVFGGGYETTREWLGLLMMTLGVREVVKYLPEKEWGRYYEVH